MTFLFLKHLLPCCLAALLMASCSSQTPEEQAMEVAQECYNALLNGDYDKFHSGNMDSEVMPEGYGEQLIMAYRQYAQQQRAFHGGLTAVKATRALMDSALNVMQVFLLQTYSDGTTEEIVVPMVEYDGKWKMK